MRLNSFPLKQPKLHFLRNRVKQTLSKKYFCCQIQRNNVMHSIIYVVGFIVVALFILSLLGIF